MTDHDKIQLLRSFASAVAKLSQHGDAVAWDQFEHLTKQMLTALLGREPTRGDMDAALLSHPENRPENN